MSTPPLLSLEEAGDALRRGEAVAFPSPCGYGWALDPIHPAAESRFALLKPNRTGPSGLVAGDLQQVRQWVELPPWSEVFTDRWPAELSLVLPGKVGLPSLISSPQGGVSLRIPDDPQTRQLTLVYGSALTATSLNFSGQPPIRQPSELAQLPEGVIAGYLPGTAGQEPPSTLVDLLQAQARILRPGSVDVGDLVAG